MFTWDIMSSLFKKSCPDCLRIQLAVVWLNLTMPNQTVKMAQRLKRSNCPKLPQLIKFSCTYWPLSFCKILKKFLGLIQSYDDVPFSSPKWSTCYENFWGGTNHYYYFHLPMYWAFSLCKILKKFFQQIQSYKDVQFLGPKWPISPK